jgi:hypothetical protein
MDEIHHKETLFDETFEMNLFVVNGFPENHGLFIFKNLLNNIPMFVSGLDVMYKIILGKDI